MKQRWIGAFLSLSAISAMGRVLGFARDVLVASLFGASGSTDVYLLAMVVFDFAFIANRTLCSSTVGYLANAGPEQEQSPVLPAKFGYYLAGSLIALGALMSVVVELVSQPLTGNYGAANVLQFKVIAYVTIPAALLLAATGVQSAVLQVLGRLDAPGWLILFFNCSGIASLLLAHQMIGIVSLPVGFFFGTVVFATFQGYLIFRRSHVQAHETSSLPGKFRRWASPALVFLGAQMIRNSGTVTDRCFASLLPVGSYSLFALATRLAFLPLTIVSNAISTSLLPIQGSAATKTRRGLVRSTEQGLLVALALSGLAAVYLWCFSDVLVRMVFERGRFNHSNSVATASVVAYLAPGIVPLVLSPVLSNVAYITGASRSLMKVALGTAFFSTLASWVAVSVTGSINGLAFAFSLSSWFNFGLLLLELWTKDGIRLTARFWAQSGIVLLCLMAVAATGLLCHTILPSRIGTDSLFSQATLIAASGVLLVAAFAGTLAFGFRSAARQLLGVAMNYCTASR